MSELYVIRIIDKISELPVGWVAGHGDKSGHFERSNNVDEAARFSWASAKFHAGLVEPFAPSGERAEIIADADLPQIIGGV